MTGTTRASSTSPGRTSGGAGTTPTPSTKIAPVDPSRTYRVTGNRGDSVYLSITVYGGPDDGHYSNRIVGTLNDRSLEFDADGNFNSPSAPTHSRVPG